MAGTPKSMKLSTWFEPLAVGDSRTRKNGRLANIVTDLSVRSQSFRSLHQILPVGIDASTAHPSFGLPILVTTDELNEKSPADRARDFLEGSRPTNQ